MIIIQNGRQTGDIVQHTHRCKIKNTPHAKLQINFDQTRDCCPQDGNQHPDEFDCVLNRYHQQNVSCGYILLKVNNK